ncbi:hypothetical protein HDV05_006833 [Chytridiales sp. JEL 0842]|nr:hypothetical protein HDV05_006833 [Chytridiales sp. JEL 0842]
MFSLGAPAKPFGGFGAASATPNPATTQAGTTPSLFGGAQAITQPAATPSLFGAQSTTQATATPSLFGGQATTQASATPSLFGGQQAQQQQQQPTTGFGGFSSSTAAATPATSAPTSSLFGAPAATTTQPASTLGGFGASTFGTKTPTPSLGGLGSTAGAAPAQAGQAGQQQQVEITKTTRYNELKDDIRGRIDNIEKFIETQIALSEEIQSSHVLEELRSVHQKTNAVKINLLDRDHAAIQNLRSLVGKEMKNADIATRFIDRHQNPHQSSAAIGSSEASLQ